jgi:methylated-DNA-[protein]-cysteine S-methyltransferase
LNLDEKIYKKLLQVLKGQITTYGELAKSVGLKNGQRTVGKMMNKNPYPVIIPCHRVVMSTGFYLTKILMIKSKEKKLLRIFLLVLS